MRTMRDVGASAYVREGAGQDRFTMYTASPSAATGPTMAYSPPPWDGSAEGYGPERTDHGVFYRKVAPMGGCRCGMAADDASADKMKWVVWGAAAVGLYFLYVAMKKPARNRPTSYELAQQFVERANRR